MKTFQVKYFNGGKYSHEYTESWEKTELFCPACGKREVHEEQSGGDYYVGTWFLCAACGAGFHLPTEPEPHPMSEQDQQRLGAIRDTSNNSIRRLHFVNTAFGRFSGFELTFAPAIGEGAVHLSISHPSEVPC